MSFREEVEKWRDNHVAYAETDKVTASQNLNLAEHDGDIAKICLVKGDKKEARKWIISAGAQLSIAHDKLGV